MLRARLRACRLSPLTGSAVPPDRMQAVSEAVERVLVAAQRQDRLTVGVYESAKLMNV